MKVRTDRPPAGGAHNEKTLPLGPGERSAPEGHASLDAHMLVGGYRLLERLGEGGMGEVWLAEQTEPVRRTVALKVIKRGMDTRRVIARFEAERQALAMMDHPAIAKIYDAGATSEGRPFFVMEHVKGVPITDHADTNRLTTRERLELFCQVCEGVQHAHQKAILHRDLKPSNILVSHLEGKAQVKIIDFGLAKATSQPLTEKAMHTQLGEQVGTFEYMSPEQAEMTGQDVDSRTDVYSLGMILYALLTGSLPFESAELRGDGVDTIRQKIRDSTPPRPSTRLSRMDGQRVARASHHRQTDPKRLVRSLQGDLDWIVLRCLEKDRSRRYGSPRELAEDIRRHLANEPVAAGPPSLSYRARKFVRRNLVGVIAASVLVLGLAVGAVGATVGLVRARRAEAKAQFEALSSETVTTVLTGMLADLDPEAAGDLLVRDVRERVEAHWRDQGAPEEEIASLLDGLDRALEGVNVTGTGLRFLDEMILSRSQGPIEEHLGERQGIAARLEHTVGTTYGRLGLASKAEPHLLRAVELRTAALGPDHAETLHSMNNLAALYLVQGRYGEAERLLLETMEARKRVLGGDHPDSLASTHNLATLYNNQGRYAEAEPLLLETARTQERRLGPDHPNTLGSKNNLAVLYWIQGRYEDAEALFVEIYEVQKKALGADHPDTLGTMNNLAVLYTDLGRYDEAEPLFLEAIPALTRVLGDDHPDTLGSMNNLAALRTDQARYVEAEAILDRTFETLEEVLGDEHPETIRSMSLLGGLYAKTERLDRAAALLGEALSKRLLILGDRHPHVGHSFYNLGCLAAARADRDEAVEYLQKALDLGWSRASIRTDPSLRALRGDPELESIVAEVEQRLAG